MYTGPIAILVFADVKANIVMKAAFPVYYAKIGYIMFLKKQSIHSLINVSFTKFIFLLFKEINSLTMLVFIYIYTSQN